MLLCEEKSGWLKGVIALVNNDEIASDVKKTMQRQLLMILGLFVMVCDLNGHHQSECIYSIEK